MHAPPPSPPPSHVHSGVHTGTDVDSLAVRSARANAQLNGLQASFTVVQCEAGLDEPDPLAQVREVLNVKPWGLGGGRSRSIYVTWVCDLECDLGCDLGV